MNTFKKLIFPMLSIALTISIFTGCSLLQNREYEPDVKEAEALLQQLELGEGNITKDLQASVTGSSCSDTLEPNKEFTLCEKWREFRVSEEYHGKNVADVIPEAVLKNKSLWFLMTKKDRWNSMIFPIRSIARIGKENLKREGHPCLSLRNFQVKLHIIRILFLRYSISEEPREAA